MKSLKLLPSNFTLLGIIPSQITRDADIPVDVRGYPYNLLATMGHWKDLSV